MAKGAPLLVVEAPGKLSRLRSLLAISGLAHWQVAATAGRLFDLPVDRLGLDAANPETPEWRPCHPGRLADLRRHVEAASEVYIATDPDDQGELIASQVLSLAGGRKSERIVLADLTATALAKALERPAGLDRQGVARALSRRLFDRLLGFTRHAAADSGGYPARPGRVRSRFAAAVHGGRCPAALATASLGETVVGQWGRCEVRAVVEGAAPGAWMDALRELGAEGLARHFSGVLEQSARRSLSEPAPSLHGLLDTLVARRGDEASVMAVADEWQRGYEAGRLSYPRTGSQSLGVEGQRRLARFAADNDLDFNPRGAPPERAEEPHDGLHPTGEGRPAPGVEVLLHERLIRYCRGLAETIPIPVAEAELRAALGSGPTEPARVALACRPRHPFYRESPEGERHVDLERSWRALRTLMGERLATPSTLAPAADALAREMLHAGSGEPNRRVGATLEITMARAPGLLDPSAAAQMEHALEADLPLRDRIHEALEAVGLDPRPLPPAVLRPGADHVRRQRR